MKTLFTYCFLVFFSMLALTTWASLDRNVWIALQDFLKDPWAIATLFDTYFAFIWFYLWFCYKEACSTKRFIGFIFTFGLGNIFMPLYVIYKIRKDKPQTLAELITQRDLSTC